MKTAVIAGATGLVGKQLMFKLLDSPLYYRVVALVRKKMPVRHEKLIQMEVDFDHLYDLKYQILGDDFFCCLGTTIKQAGSKAAFYKVDFTYCYELARIASANGAHRFLLVSAVGADAKSSIFYSRVKGELENAIKKLNFPHFQVFRPSFLVGERVQSRLGEKLGIGFAKAISPLMLGMLEKYKPIEAVQVATSMLHAAQQDSKKKVKTYTFADMMNS
jgi:uncharacterized protein YbjT (DUF2867 family)